MSAIKSSPTAGVSSDVESLPTNHATRPASGGMNHYLSREIHNYLTSLPILACCFTSGLIDAVVFNAWGVFACIQTGNTIILALGAAHLPEGHGNAWLQTLVPIVFYFLGAFMTGRITRPLGPLRRVVLGTSFLTQCVLVVIAAAIIQTGYVPGRLNDGEEPLITLIPLALLAVQAGMQSVTARQLGINEIPTTVLTSVYCDLGNDPKLFAPFKENWSRNRRFGAAICILLGAIIGGFLTKTSAGMAAALWFAAAVKGLLSVAWICWAANPKQQS